MPYLIITNDLGEELDRRELAPPGLLVGRAAECNLAIHDILLSRRHCHIEPIGENQWQVTDLQSKNGTHLNGHRLSTPQRLAEGDRLRVGRSYLVFKSGPYRSAGEKSRGAKVIRPLDPFEALSGTVQDFVLLEDGDPKPEVENDYDPAPSSPVPPVFHADLSDSGVWQAASSNEPWTEWAAEWTPDTDTSPATMLIAAKIPLRHAAGRLRAVPTPQVKRRPSSMSLEAGIDCLPRRTPTDSPCRTGKPLLYATLLTVASGLVTWSLWILTQPL